MQIASDFPLLKFNESVKELELQTPQQKPLKVMTSSLSSHLPKLGVSSVNFVFNAKISESTSESRRIPAWRRSFSIDSSDEENEILL